MSRQGQLRIIAGDWRGRKLAFPDIDGLRPTPGRVRETLFNWLQLRIHGARCLDLFAGSGALGFESASRGAARVVMVERDPRAAASIAANVERLDSDRLILIGSDAFGYLERCNEVFDIVYLDPPFADRLHDACFEQLESNACLAEGALVYTESAAGESMRVPPGWECFKHKRAGQVEYRLYQREDRRDGR